MENDYQHCFWNGPVRWVRLHRRYCQCILGPVLTRRWLRGWRHIFFSFLSSFKNKSHFIFFLLLLSASLSVSVSVSDSVPIPPPLLDLPSPPPLQQIRSFDAVILYQKSWNCDSAETDRPDDTRGAAATNSMSYFNPTIMKRVETFLFFLLTLLLFLLLFRHHLLLLLILKRSFLRIWEA